MLKGIDEWLGGSTGSFGNAKDLVWNSGNFGDVISWSKTGI